MVAHPSAKHWTFTLNNYDEFDLQRLRTSNSSVRYLIYGKEVGENGTPHLQGFVSFNNRVRMSTVKAFVGSAAHVECARNVLASIEYCKKDGDVYEAGTPPGGSGSRSDLEEFKDAVKGGLLSLPEIRDAHSKVYAKYPRFCIEYLQDHLPKKVLPTHAFRPWQVELATALNRPPCDRKIYFIVDPVGNQGKSWFAHTYRTTHLRVQVLSPGKITDMAYALDTRVRVLFIDCPRSRSEFLQYSFLEEVKNGYVDSPKYESRMKEMERCHVVVLMNEEPDLSKLSADRPEVIRLG